MTIRDLYYPIVFAVSALVILLGVYCDKKEWKVGKLICYGLVFLIIMLFF